MLKVGFHTLGCKVNQYETEAIVELFEQRGYEIVDFDEVADIYVVNTCTVTNIADKKSRKMLSKAKSMNQEAIVVAMGCYAQIAQNQLQENSEIDLIIGSTKKNEVVDQVENYLREHEKINTVEDMTHQNEYEDLWVSRNEDKKRAHIKIQDGCNQFCSYCIIPYTRGRVRSRDPESIVKEVMTIVGHGYREIVLTGIHLASYGVELHDCRLIDLLKKLNEVEGLKRIRLGSLEPTLVTPVFVEKLSKLSKICPHFHLSLQSGCDETLKRMNRKYTTEDYRQSVKTLRDFYGKPSITTDIIVGFPGETEEEFTQTLQFVREIAFADLHVFKFSKREGTKAASMPNVVDEKVKNERSKILTEARNTNHHQFLEQFIGETLEVLFEGSLELTDQLFYMGHAANYLKIIVEKEANNLESKMLKVQLQKVFGEFIKGEISAS
ncbi:MAG: tRNA (N(6)-L-threonylcarbamoyladenosine(37)-C(2))-methylthiotransferase MtaB [Vallitaleaceae bacterium]|nr:tRNA (N(6)-L-threonylcarbamoyladenosine(37)-C(2))-methylthiotransferase MtaB [Vallitaleaceae bacterium]